MADRLKERLRHSLITFLLSVGLVMPLCGAMDDTLLSLRVIMVVAGVILTFEAVSLHRISVWAAVLTAGAGFTVWILAGNGTRTLTDAALAVSLRMRGIRTAVPLAANTVSNLTAVTVTLICCFATLQKATCIPAVMMCTAVMMAVWITDSMSLLPWLLPALAAVLTLLLTNRFEETGTVRVLPWAAALTAIAFLLTGIAPAENPVKDRADELRQAILDRLFFTEARDVFSLYSVGFSPQGADQLGGKPNPSQNKAMQVSTSKTAYLRGTVYNRYDGHGWQNTTGGRRYLWQSGRMSGTRAELFDEALPPDTVQNSLSEPVTVSVRMLSGSASTLFVPQRIRELNPGGEMVPYFSNSSEVFITRNLLAGDTYEISAPLYSSEDPEIGTIVEICAGLADQHWETVRNTYLELPSHLGQSVTELAAQITSGANTPFQKASAIRDYLKKNCIYTTDVDEHPADVDFVTAFLLETRKGYCTYFASAMTVLCRLAGLPARYVEGYLAVPDENGTATVTGFDAHAWTEVYFEGFGWLTFDATPGRSSAGQQGNEYTEQQNTPVPEPTPTEEPETSGPPKEIGTETPEPADKQPQKTEDNIPDASPQNTPEPSASAVPAKTDDDAAREGSDYPWWLLLLIIPAVTALRIMFTSPVLKEKRAGTEEKRFDIWTEEITALLRAEQLERRCGETPMTFALRADESGFFSESVSTAAECISRIRYSTAKPLESDTGLLRDTALLLRSELKGRGKTRYLINRLLPRRKEKKSSRKL